MDWSNPAVANLGKQHPYGISCYLGVTAFPNSIPIPHWIHRARAHIPSLDLDGNFGENPRASKRRCRPLRSRFAPSHETGVQASGADGVLVSNPSKESFQPETVSTMRGGTISVRSWLDFGTDNAF